MKIIINSRLRAIPVILGRAVALALCAGLGVVILACSAAAEPGGTGEPPADGAAPTAAPDTAVARDFQARGELIFNTRANLAFEIPGEIGAVNVAVGDRVAAGEVLATLDAETVAAAQTAAAQAKVNVENAQERLDQIMGLESSDPLVRARAESALANAEIALERAQERLEDYQVNYDVQLAAARQNVANAEAAVDRADDAVVDFGDNHSEQFAQALSNRSTAKIALDNAENAIRDFLPQHTETVARLRSRIAATENSLDDAREAVQDFDDQHAEKVLQARQAVAQAENAVSDAQDRMDDFNQLIADGKYFTNKERNDNPGATFDVVQLRALRAGINLAEKDRDEKQRDLDELLAGPKESDRTVVVERVAELEAALAQLNLEMDDVRDGPNSNELERLENAVTLARERLERAERDLAEVEEGVDLVELARLEAAADQSRVALQSARSQRARLEKGPDQAALDGLIKDVATARQARDDLSETAGSADIALAQANIDAATATYERAAADVDKTMLRAPIAGIVRLVTIAPGEAATLDVRAIQIVDPYDVSVLGLVDSNYIDRISVAAPAEVTLSAVPGRVYAAQVVEISETARTERGIISFPALLNVTVPRDAPPPLHPGLVSVTFRQ